MAYEMTDKKLNTIKLSIIERAEQIKIDNLEIVENINTLFEIGYNQKQITDYLKIKYSAFSRIRNGKKVLTWQPLYNWLTISRSLLTTLPFQDEIKKQEKSTTLSHGEEVREE